MSAAVAADVDRIKPTTIRLMNIFVYLSMVICVCVCCEFILLVAGVFSFLVALSLAFYSSSRDYQSDLIVCLIFMCTSFSLQLINFMRKMCVCIGYVQYMPVGSRMSSMLIYVRFPLILTDNNAIRFLLTCVGAVFFFFIAYNLQTLCCLCQLQSN